MSLLLDALVTKVDSGRNTLSTPQLQGPDQKLVQHINTLQEQLYAERREKKSEGRLTMLVSVAGFGSL